MTDIFLHKVISQIIQFSILNFKSDCFTNKDQQYNKTFFISTMES